MKKFISLTVFGLLTFTAVSCTRTADVVQPVTQTNTVNSITYDYKVNFFKSSTSNSLYGFYSTFPAKLYNSDVVLVYRQDGTSSGNPIWKFLPKTYFLTQGDLDYTFDFTVNDFQIYANGNFDLSAQNSTFNNTYLNNQVFRVVAVASDFGKKSVSKIDYTDYDAVAKFYNIKESDVKKL